ncbi:unnamed protein product [Linum trigynum]|uniref:Uncharacterized protein n=1 Tax=Linum trigynum TaxID=586398 RepID=A0AAV2FDI2_9ROSI
MRWSCYKKRGRAMTMASGELLRGLGVGTMLTGNAKAGMESDKEAEELLQDEGARTAMAMASGELRRGLGMPTRRAEVGAGSVDGGRV